MKLLILIRLSSFLLQDDTYDNIDRYHSQLKDGSDDTPMDMSNMRVTQLVDTPEDAYKLMGATTSRQRRLSPFAAMRGKRTFTESASYLKDSLVDNSKRSYPFGGYVAIRGKRIPRSMLPISDNEYRFIVNSVLRAASTLSQNNRHEGECI